MIPCLNPNAVALVRYVMGDCGMDYTQYVLESQRCGDGTIYDRRLWNGLYTIPCLFGSTERQ